MRALLVLASLSLLMFAGCASHSDSHPSSSTPAKTTPVKAATRAVTTAEITSTDVDPTNFFKFSPATIAGKLNNTLTITLKGAAMNTVGHDLVIDDYNVHIPSVDGGGSATASFNLTKKGTFPYYCDIGNHRQLGMEGSLTVA